MRKANLKDIEEIVSLSLLLFSNNDYKSLKKEIESILVSDTSDIFLTFQDNKAIGFAQCSMRYEYVEGTSTNPVGYLEGVYVKDNYRNLGVAKKLVHCCEKWVREQGAKEFASDCELDNEVSFIFHLKLGFLEANRIICFNKEL